MTPEEIYEARSISSTPWHRDFSEVVPEVLKIDIDFDTAQRRKPDSKNLIVHLKLNQPFDGHKSVNVYALTFEDKPFAIMFTGGRSGADERKHFVTDASTWMEARNYIQSVSTEIAALALPAAQTDAELLQNFHGASFINTEDGLIVVDSRYAHPSHGTLIYDQKKFKDAWRRLIQTGLVDSWKQTKSATPEMWNACLFVYRVGLVGETINLDMTISESQQLFAASVIDDVTFAHAFNPKPSFRDHDFYPTAWPVGPGSMLECYKEISEGRALNADLPYIRDLVKSTSVTEKTAIEITTDFITNGGANVLERIASVLPKDERVPECIIPYNSGAMAFLIVDDPSLTRFCPYVTETWAQKFTARASTIASAMKYQI